MCVYHSHASAFNCTSHLPVVVLLSHPLPLPHAQLLFSNVQEPSLKVQSHKAVFAEVNGRFLQVLETLQVLSISTTTRFLK